MRKRIFLLCIVFLELLVITFLAGKIYLEKSQVLGENISINPISKDDVIFPIQDNDSDLKNFYEPKPNKIKTDIPAWMPQDYTYTATINADSLNERFDYSIEKKLNVFRIVTIGDSFTYGLYVDTKENYPERLEDMLNDSSSCRTTKKFEVINLGVGGYDIEYSVHRFKVRGKKYNPDLILWLIKDYNFFTLNEFVRPKMEKYRKEMKEDKDLITEYQSEGNYYPWVVKAVKDVILEFGEERVLSYSEKAMEKISDYHKRDLVFISFFEMISGPYRSLLQSFINEKNDVYLYDGLDPSYDRFEDWHPTGKGYAQIADQIFNYLTRNKIIPCGSL